MGGLDPAWCGVSHRRRGVSALDDDEMGAFRRVKGGGVVCLALEWKVMSAGVVRSLMCGGWCVGRNNKTIAVVVSSPRASEWWV